VRGGGRPAKGGTQELGVADRTCRKDLRTTWNTFGTLGRARRRGGTKQAVDRQRGSAPAKNPTLTESELKL